LRISVFTARPLAGANAFAGGSGAGFELSLVPESVFAVSGFGGFSGLVVFEQPTTPQPIKNSPTNTINFGIAFTKSFMHSYSRLEEPTRQALTTTARNTFFIVSPSDQ
jgi:hypothetical protein